MAHNETSIGTLIKEDRQQEAADALIAALEANGGNVVHTALAMGVHHATVKRWIQRLTDYGWDVRDHLHQIREEEPAPTPLSTAERKAKELQVREDRELARVRAWLQRVPDDTRRVIAKSAGCRLDTVSRVVAGQRVKDSLRDAILGAVRRELAVQRAAWRKEHANRLKSLR